MEKCRPRFNGGRLEDFLDWTMLVSAYTQRRQGVPVLQLAKNLGTTERTLRVAARRHTAFTFARLTEMPPDQFAELFRSFFRRAKILTDDINERRFDLTQSDVEDAFF
jgi:hypothetical protein